MCNSGVCLRNVQPIQLYAFEKTFFGTQSPAEVFDDQYETEPKLMAVGLGDSIAEWDWLEPEQIQRLRQQCLVLVEMNSYRK